VGGTTVKRGSEGEARTETSILKMARADIELNPIYAYLCSGTQSAGVIFRVLVLKMVGMQNSRKKWQIGLIRLLQVDVFR